ncbi:lysophospholipase [Flavobacterium sp. CBA20B-1]|uniref:alpha/beta hydrolase family protein n=1 Tax=unclassified Flavobacterium TaxID=196869 RepID=UPI002224F4AE|nr:MULTISPECIES: lysophospholipase [unclassified Flavobacterium]WCM42308.1 lysophospholipase [Flavobacterium sp. CBA20B-1]
MKKIILLFALLFSFVSFAQIEGTWNGNIELPTGKLPFVLHITKENGQYKATSDSPDQGVYGIELQEIRFENNTLFLKDARMFMSYEGELANANAINGNFKQGGQSFKLNFKKGTFTRNRPQEPQPPFSYKIQDITFENKEAGIKLAGTLTMPNGKGPFPAVVLVSGSGAQDRNEELLGHKPFLLIADRLTKNGFAVLRYDDRGVAQSEGNFESATTFDFAKDTKSALEYLKTIKEIDRKNIGILGHSEGGMIAQIVAAENKDVAFIISLAGPGIAIDELMLTQKYEIEKAYGLSNEDLEASKNLYKKIYEIIKNNPSNEKAKQAIKSFLKTDPAYKELSEKQINDLAAATDSNWFTTFIRYNPEKNIAKIKAKALILNGEKDVQVTAKENLEGWRKGLAHNKNVTIKSYPNLNHLFQLAKTGMPDEYGTIETTMEPAVLEDITKWLNENVK